MIHYTILKELIKHNSLKSSWDIFSQDAKGTKDLAGLAIEFTVFLLVMALVLVPVGMKEMLNVNQTAVGITAGSTTATIFDNIVPIMLVVILLGILYMVKGGENRK